MAKKPHPPVDHDAPEEKARRRRVLWLTLLLLVGLPLYLIVASFLVAALPRPHWFLEMIIYVLLGLVWAFPLKRLVIGAGRAAPPSS
ncbi:MAG: DUF2842 domain-containing protein [Pseudomonadota bacterium]